MARPATPADEISFHDGSIVGIAQTEDGISISIELAEFNRFKDASVHVYGVQGIRRDGAPIAQFTMESEDGEVLDVNHAGKLLKLLIEWSDYGSGRRTTVEYQIECDSIRVWI